MPRRLPLTPRLTDPGHDQWCWAAVAATVGDFKDHIVWKQCGIAERTLNDPACCQPGLCNRPAQLDAALAAVQHFFSAASGSVEFSRVQEEIDADRPIGVRIGWTGGGVGHFLTVIGYNELETEVIVADPKYGESAIPLTTLQSSYKALGMWTDTYFTV